MRLYYYAAEQTACFDTPRGTVTLAPASQPPLFSSPAVFPCAAVLGLLSVDATTAHLLFVTHEEFCGEHAGVPIHRILKVDAIPICISPSNPAEAASSEALSNLKSLLEDHHFYYALPRSSAEEAAAAEALPIDFVWNTHIMENLRAIACEQTADARSQDSPLTSRHSRMYASSNASSPAILRDTRVSSRNNSENKSKIKLSEILESISTGEETESLYNDNSRAVRPSSSLTGSKSQRLHLTGATSAATATRVFCGYFEVQTFLATAMHTYAVLSLIGTRRIGPRMRCRGVDVAGAAAFTVETRFEMVGPSGRDSFKILRGTVPLFWSQRDPLRPRKLQLERTADENELAFIRHFDYLERMYSLKTGDGEWEGSTAKNSSEISKHYENVDVIRVHTQKAQRGADKQGGNLKDSQKMADSPSKNSKTAGQATPSTAAAVALKLPSRKIIAVSLLGHHRYERALQRAFKEYCRTHLIDLLHFDMNAFTNDYESLKKRFYSKLKKVVYKKMVREGATLDKKLRSAEIRRFLHENKIIFRVNCLDCLDRSNLAQFLIFDFLYPTRFKAVKSLWKHNGNALSNFYTGSNALKADLANHGKISLIGRMNDLLISANRMLNNKFNDKAKESAIDMLLGRMS